MSTAKSPQRQDADAVVPFSLRVAAAASWRFLTVVGVLYVLSIVLGTLRLVVVPVAIALLLAALLAPAVSRMARLQVPRGVATAVVLIGGIAIVGGVLTFVVNAFISGLPALGTQVTASLNTIRDWLVHGPFHMRMDQLDQLLTGIVDWVKNNQTQLTSGAFSTATTVGELLTGALLTLFTLIFFLYDGRGIWGFLIRLLPEDLRDRLDAAGTRAFGSLVSYVRGTAMVALVDSISIGIGLVFMGIPLAVPLAALVFLGAFVPIIGALLSGLVAVLIALVAKGAISALLVLALLIGVQQLEGHVLQPLLLGRAVRLHPLAVVLAISAGLVMGGIAGALLAVPLVAALNSAIRTLVGYRAATAGPETPAASTAKPAAGPEKPATAAGERE